MTDDAELLRQYVQTGSEDAFAELVHRHLPVVYSSALRQSGGDVELAKDICQTVFIDLGRKARSLLGHELVIGWLFAATRFTAADMLRGNRRRQNRESIAASMHENAAEHALEDPRLTSALDAAMAELPSEDRNAVLLRFFQGKPLREVGAALGTNEDAARMRVTRALGRLHGLLKQRGVTLSVAALGTALAAQVVTAVPVGLAATITAAALAGTTITTTATATKALTMTTMQKAVITIAVAGSVTTSLLLTVHNRARLSEAREVLRQRAAQVLHVQEENERLGSLAAFSSSPSANNPDELRKTREEVAGLRRQTNGLSALQKERWQLQYSLNKARQDSQDANVQPSEWSEEAKAKAKYSDQLVRALWDYAAKHQNQFPTNFDDAAAFVSARAGKDARFTPDQFEVVYQGSTTALAKYANPALVLLISEKQPWKNTDGKWAKIYATGVGIDIISVADGKFDAFEKAHILPPESWKP